MRRLRLGEKVKGPGQGHTVKEVVEPNWTVRLVLSWSRACNQGFNPLRGWEWPGPRPFTMLLHPRAGFLVQERKNMVHQFLTSLIAGRWLCISGPIFCIYKMWPICLAIPARFKVRCKPYLNCNMNTAQKCLRGCLIQLQFSFLPIYHPKHVSLPQLPEDIHTHYHSASLLNKHQQGEDRDVVTKLTAMWCSPSPSGIGVLMRRLRQGAQMPPPRHRPLSGSTNSLESRASSWILSSSYLSYPNVYKLQTSWGHILLHFYCMATGRAPNDHLYHPSHWMKGCAGKYSGDNSQRFIPTIHLLFAQHFTCLMGIKPHSKPTKIGRTGGIVK